MEFAYLGHTVAYNNSNWTELDQNHWNARRRWAMVGKVVTKTEATVREQGVIYKDFAQLVLLYGIKSWVVTMFMLNYYRELHH